MPYARSLAMLSLLGCSVVAVGCKSVSQGGPGLPQARIVATPDLVGFVTTLDGASSSDPAGRSLSYSWRFSGVPMGSQVTNASLSAATSAQTTFEPDLGGTYSVTLRVQAGDDVNELTKAVEVPSWPVYFADSNITPTGGSISFNAIRSDGTGLKALSCPLATDMGTGTGGDNTPLQAFAIASFGTIATYESGEDPLFAFPQMAFTVDTVNDKFQAAFQMFVGSSRTDCMTRPASRVDTLAPVVLGAGVVPFYLFTRFSPNGKRLAFMSLPQGGSGRPSLITVGIDGRDMRVVASDITTTPVSWIDDTNLAYLASTGSGYIVKRTADVMNGGASGTTIHDCGTTFSQIGQIEVRGNTIFLAGQVTQNDPFTIFKNTLGTCAAVPFVTTEAGASAADFSISPDGKTMLFASSTGFPPLDLGDSFVNRLTDIWSVPVDGSSAPKKLGGDPMLIDFGARFIANGRQIIWTQFAPLRETDMGGGGTEPTSTSIWIANADGSKAHKLFGPQGATPAGSYRLVVGGAHSGLIQCAMGDGDVTVLALAFLLAALVALGVRRTARARR